MSYFTKKAEGLDKNLLVHPWAVHLREGMKRSAPQLLAEFENEQELDSYILVKTSDALAMVEMMIGQGMPRDMAEELVKADLIPSD